jgi:hypothetical protein
MPDSWVVLWTLERCRWLQRVGDEGPLEVIFGGPHTSMPSIEAVRVGDRIYPVSVNEGALCVIAAMKVESLISPEDFVRQKLGIVCPPDKMWDQLFRELKQSQPSVGHRVPFTCADLAAVGTGGSRIRFDRNVPGADLPAITLGSKPGREQPLKGVIDGRLKNNFSLQGHVRRLSEKSAEMFAACFEKTR